MKKSLFMIMLAICMMLEIGSVPVVAAEVDTKPEIDIRVPSIAQLIRNYRKEMKISQEPSNATYPKELLEKKEAEKSKPKKINMGEFKITYYCGCYSCSEGWGNMTATGVTAKEGRTIAVDPSVISYGTHVEINGHEYIAEDCGGAIKGNDIDIYLEDHDRVYQGGVDYYDVWILKE